MLSVLRRTLVLPFYVRNAGTFLVVILLLFGFMRPMDHEALITAALGSPFLLAVVFTLWGLYAGQTVTFVRRQLNAPEHLFLQTFRLVNPPTRRAVWLWLLTELLLPVIGYAVWMGARAVHYRAWWPLVAISLTVLTLIATGAWFADDRLQRPSPQALRLPSLNVRLPYPLFFPAYWLRHEPLSLLLTKTISCLLLMGVCRLYPTDDYDERLLLLGLMLALITHSQLGRQLDTFEHRFLLILPNLPLSRGQRLSRYGLTYGLIWLPELGILLRNGPEAISLPYLTGLWLTGWGWLMLLHTLAYERDVAPDRWQTRVFWGFIVGLLAIMFGVPVAVWGLVGWLGAAGVGYWPKGRRTGS